MGVSWFWSWWMDKPSWCWYCFCLYLTDLQMSALSPSKHQVPRPFQVQQVCGFCACRYNYSSLVANQSSCVWVKVLKRRQALKVRSQVRLLAVQCLPPPCSNTAAESGSSWVFFIHSSINPQCLQWYPMLGRLSSRNSVPSLFEIFKTPEHSDELHNAGSWQDVAAFAPRCIGSGLYFFVSIGASSPSTNELRGWPPFSPWGAKLKSRGSFSTQQMLRW